MTESVVLFNEIKTADGQRFGVATLNAPASLNSLSVDMVRAADAASCANGRRTTASSACCCDAAGEKAFCAGGDLRQLYQTLLDCGPARNDIRRALLRRGVRARPPDPHLPEALPVLGPRHRDGRRRRPDGGLLAPRGHAQSRVAMPEINIGLYPDVGGSWFLRRMPGRVGLFLALRRRRSMRPTRSSAAWPTCWCRTSARRRCWRRSPPRAWQRRAQADRAALSRLLAQAGRGRRRCRRRRCASTSTPSTR